jgi:hypothetical protein
MSRFELIAVDPEGVAPLPISAKLRTQLVYFAAAAKSGVDPLGENEYRFDLEEATNLLDEGVIRLVSPLDTANATEVELSEEQETMLEWIKKNRVIHARLSENAK